MLPLDLRQFSSGARLQGVELVPQRRTACDPDGHSIARRLGIPDESSVPQLLDAAYGALERWRRVESSPLTSREAKIAARGVVRTCEGIVAALVPARV